MNNIMGSRVERLKLTEEAIKLRNHLTLEEKIWLMSGNLQMDDIKAKSVWYTGGLYYLQNVFFAGGIADKNVPSMRFCDGTRGLIGGENNICFPSPMCRGASFNRILEKAIGRALGNEVKANGGNLFAGICINLLYHPGWGRSQETYGEESWHIGEMGSALVEGVQEEDVIACIKHFAFHSMEYSRFRVDIVCDKRTEREVFLPHFKKCIDHGAAAVMSAYNSYQGEWCGQNSYLLNQVLKKEWEFDGFVISDFILGIRDTVKSANSGMDIEMYVRNWFGEQLLQAVRAGEVEEKQIDDAVLRIIRTLLAVEKNVQKKNNERKESSKQIDLALQAAREGITLIKNASVLPLNKHKTKRIVVLGNLADKENLGDHSMEWIKPPYTVSPLQGIANIAHNAEVIYYGGKNLNHAVKLALGADAVVFIVGYDDEDEGECSSIVEEKGEILTDTECPGDRMHSLGLHEDDIQLLNTVGPVNKNSIAVLIGGSMIMIEEWKNSVSAILMAYYPGMEGGTAIAEILFGDVNPSGKLPFVIPYRETDLPKIEWETDKQVYDYYHGYVKLDKEKIEPSVPFGFGLSYTTFSLSDIDFKSDEEKISASCVVENTGEYEGAEIIQLYIGFSNSRIERPIKLLRGFERVILKKGEQRRVELLCPLDEIKWYNPLSGEMELEHMEYDVFIGTSSSNKNLIRGNVLI